jgi:two-component system chemotaxis sensor kinase CheA
VVRDPYKYFRIEARELLEGLGRGALELEKGNGGAEVVVQMLRLAHTLKGASRVVKQPKIAELAHAVEDVLAPYREKAHSVVARDHVNRLLGLVDAVSSSLVALEPASSAASDVSAPTAPEPLKNVRVEIEEMDSLLEGVFEVAVRLTAIRRDSEELARARGLAAILAELTPSASRARSVAEELRAVIGRAERDLGVGLDHADHEITQVREKANQLRLMPASVVFPMLELGARDAAQSLDKSVRFETSGGEHRLEANVLFALRDALLHVVRNAVAHGIEPEAERRSLGKLPHGRVQLDVQRRGNRIAFVCRDDGRGIDTEAVRSAAVARGLLTASDAAAMGPERVLRLILESGVTTTDKITQVSGRGIGLDVLRATAAQLKGDVVITSQAGQGTTVDVCVPCSISSISALVLEAAGVTVSVPLDTVQQTLSVARSEIARSPESHSVLVDGAIVPFLPLAVALGRPLADDRSTRPWTAVVLRAGARVAAIGVDRLVGTSTIVLRPLPKLAGPTQFAAGASFDVEGNPQLVLDPRGLVDAAHTAPRDSRFSEPSERRKAPILVIDDSLTTRMLEQSILESAGYEVDLATSAEEGLSKARVSSYGLFLVDVEMPGMDGFEFVSQTRSDVVLRAIPSILVTSRDAPQDRRRGEEVGARAYIVKREFDQGHLLRVIRQLIG